MRTRTLDSYLETITNEPNPFTLSDSQKLKTKQSVSRVPTHRKPLYSKPIFPSSEYEIQQKLKKQNKAENGYSFEFENMEQFFNLQSATKQKSKKTPQNKLEDYNSFFITQKDENPVQHHQQLQKSQFQVSNETYAKNLRDLKGKIKFNPEIALIEANGLEKRRNAEKAAILDIHTLNQQNKEVENRNNTIASEIQENQIKLESLIQVQSNLEQKYIIIHKELLEFERKKQQQEDLTDLFQQLEQAFPGQKALNILQKFETLTSLTNNQIDEKLIIHDKIKLAENDAEASKLQLIQQKYITDMHDKQEMYALTRQIDTLGKQNSEKNQDVIKAQEIQAQYLQLCQNITTYWIKYGKAFGGDLPQFITPSVNNPLEVLRAMDTIFSCAFPESEKAQQNFKKINGHATHVWQKLLSLDPDQACAKSDTVGMLQKARYLVSCSAAEEKELLGMKQRLMIQKDTILEELSEKWRVTNEIIQQVRNLGENSEMRWEFALYANAQRDLQNREVQRMQKGGGNGAGKGGGKGSVEDNFYGV